MSVPFRHLKRKERNADDEEARERKRVRLMSVAEIAAEILQLRAQLRQAVPRVEEPASPMLLLPVELLIEFMRHLTQRVLIGRVARVCRQWNDLVNDSLSVIDCRRHTPFIPAYVQAFQKYTRLDTLLLPPLTTGAHFDMYSGVAVALPGVKHLDLGELSVLAPDLDDYLPALCTLSATLNAHVDYSQYTLPATLTQLTLRIGRAVTASRMMVDLRGLTALHTLEISAPANEALRDFRPPAHLGGTLRRLVMDNVAQSDRGASLWNALRGFTALEHLSLRSMPQFKGFWGPDSPVLPSLTRLSFYHCRELSLSDLARCAHLMPNVTHLDIRENCARATLQASELNAFGRLEVLVLYLSTTFLSLEFLRGFPALKRLELITKTGLMSRDFHHLEQLPVSVLETLVLSGEPPIDEPTHPLLKRAVREFVALKPTISH